MGRKYLSDICRMACVLVPLLLVVGCKEKRGQTPFGAAFLGGTEYLRNWTASGGDPNLVDEDGQSLIYIATSPKGNAEAVKVLLEAGADPNLFIQGGHSPLMNAIANGDLEMVKALVESGADVAYGNAFCVDASDYARRCGRVGIIGYLENIKK